VVLPRQPQSLLVARGLWPNRTDYYFSIAGTDVAICDGAVWCGALASANRAGTDSHVYGVDISQPAPARLRRWSKREPAVDIGSPVNAGISQVNQTFPGQVLPDRYSDQASVAHAKAAPGDSPKAKALRLRFP
jgi:hypothetical protein